MVVCENCLKLQERTTYLEHADLSHGDLLDEGVVLRLDELLDGDQHPRVPVPALEHHSVGAFADFRQLFVLVHAAWVVPLQAVVTQKVEVLDQLTTLQWLVWFVKFVTSMKSGGFGSQLDCTIALITCAEQIFHNAVCIALERVTSCLLAVMLPCVTGSPHRLSRHKASLGASFDVVLSCTQGTTVYREYMSIILL